MDGTLAEVQSRYFAAPEPERLKSDEETIAVLGLGYVGLPVSLAFAEVYETVIGFDIDPTRIASLALHHDRTHEVPEEVLRASDLMITGAAQDLAGASVYVVTVPTPIDADRRPDFSPLVSACRSIAPYLGRGDLVIFESTVYPGATEEICAPALERYSGLSAGEDFHLAYSPERLSPGDGAHGLRDIPKIVSADDPAALERAARLYARIVPAGVHRAPSMKVAEAAKVFENTQRDVNIALMNEFSQICEHLGMRSRDVMEATATKWNALPFSPGLVGGHCIGVDPFYLIERAERAGVHPEIMIAGRRCNEAVAPRIAEAAVRMISETGLPLARAKVGLFGLTYKEDVPDMRNTKVVDLISALGRFGIAPLLHDPIADRSALKALGLSVRDDDCLQELDLAILAVPHSHYADGARVLAALRPGGALIDLRGVLDPRRLPPEIAYWSL